MHRRFIAAIFPFLFVLAAAAAGAEPLSRDRIIVVGGNRDYPPYEFLDKEGNPSGYNVDLTKAIADVMGMKVSFRLTAWVDVRKALDTGEIDVLQGMSYSEGRAKVVDFSIPHTIVNHCVFAREGTPAVQSLEDLSGKEVAFHNRGFMHDFAREKGIDLKPVLTDTQADALRLVASGKYDYAIVASLPGASIIKESKLTNVVPVARSVATVKYCYAVKKGNGELLARFNEGLAILKKTGQYEAIYDKWLGVLEPRGVSWGKLVKYGSGVMALFFLVIGGTLAWSRALGKQVAIRTAELENEVRERKRAAEELRLRQRQLVEADKMASLGTLVSGVAHEINNPNALILLNTPLILDYVKDIGPIAEAYYQEHGDFEVAGLPYSRIRTKVEDKLLDMQESARKIKRIVDDLKDFARRDDSDHTCLVDMNGTVRTAVRLVENTVRKSTNHFVEQYAEDIPRIRGNAQRIEQVLVNLILNACEALRSPEEAIALSTRHDPVTGHVVVEIRDTGHGIAAEHLKHLTEPFFTTKREQGGTGLGLSVSDGIVREHRGFLEFASEVGIGTTVTLRLPVATEEDCV